MTPLSIGAQLVLPVLSAGLLWFSFPGGGELWPVVFVALFPLLYLAQKSSLKESFYAGLLTGFCHFILVLYWIIIVLGKYGGLPWYFSVPALVLLSLYMAIFTGFFAMFSAMALQRFDGLVVMWSIPAIWVGLDWLRATLFSGFPWMDPGYALWQFPILIQTADLLGHHGITYMIVLINSLLMLLWTKRKKRWLRVKMTSSVSVLLIALAIYGYVQWHAYEMSLAEGETVAIGVVQGNIDQSKKWTPEEQRGTVAGYIEQTASLFKSSRPPQLVIWPETALPFFPTANPLMADLQKFVGESRATLLTGSPWFEIIDPATRQMNFYNSAFLLLPSGGYGDRYYKSHLVPFGEYVPLKKFLFFLAPLVEAVGDFTPGTVEKPLSAGPIRGGILICFESIFPEIARKWTVAGANVLINLTNDAWYGRSSAPVHSMAMSVFRAVETRRSLVRAANTGISGFVDPLGRVNDSSAIFVPWAKSMDVNLMENATFFTRYGYHFGPLCFCVLLITVTVARFGRKSASGRQ